MRQAPLASCPRSGHGTAPSQGTRTSPPCSGPSTPRTHRRAWPGGGSTAQRGRPVRRGSA
eukprot:7099376-Pyramimonas_sp.AAC.1